MKTDLISRRSFLSVVGAVGAAAALTACVHDAGLLQEIGRAHV